NTDDGFLLRLDHAKNLKWVKTIKTTHKGGNAPYFSLVGTKVVSYGSHFYLSTYLFKDTVDFDPGPGITLLSAHKPQYAWRDITFSRFDSLGNLNWAYSVGPCGYYAEHPPFIVT